MMLLIICFLVFTQNLLQFCDGDIPVKSLFPEKTVYNDVLFDREVAVYEAKDLLPYSSYEVRLSYPSTVPTDFTINVIPPYEVESYKSRHMFNIEKTVFTTNHITEGYMIRLTARRTGFPWNSERMYDPVVYDIALDTLHFGLSAESWQVVGYAFLIFFSCAWYIVPRVHEYIVSIIAKNDHTN